MCGRIGPYETGLPLYNSLLEKQVWHENDKVQLQLMISKICKVFSVLYISKYSFIAERNCCVHFFSKVMSFLTRQVPTSVFQLAYFVGVMML